KLFGRRVFILHVIEGLREKAASTSRRVEDCFAYLRINDSDHRADNLARREELAAVVALLAHFQEQPLEDLRKREDVRCVYVLLADFMHLVEYVKKVLFRINARVLNAGHDFADNLLPRAGVRMLYGVAE